MIPRTIIIRPTLNGYNVRVGCQDLVFQSTDTLLAELGCYLRNPEAIESAYSKTALHRELMNSPRPPEPLEPGCAIQAQAAPNCPEPRAETSEERLRRTIEGR